MVCWQLPDGIHIHIPKPVHLFERCDIPVFEHLYKLHENFRRCPCIIYRTVMIFQRDSQCLCHDIQLVF